MLIIIIIIMTMVIRLALMLHDDTLRRAGGWHGMVGKKST